ncbi:MAG: hypothetical protein AAB731_01385 [Patescibacteria group bacterium]
MAEKSVVYTDFGMSRGMEYGVQRAKTEGRPVEFRTLPKEELEKLNWREF